MTTISSVISNGAVRGAYQTSQSLPTKVTAELEPSVENKQSFADLVTAAAQDAMNNIRQAETIVEGGLTGQATTQQVVEATMALEMTVRMTVGMRNKFVEAYQEILRMPI